MTNIDNPFGDGVPSCEKCHGRGVVPVPPRPESKIVGGRTRPCDCILARDILRNVERGWPSLSAASPIQSSPLLEYKDQFVMVTSSMKAAREHIRHVAVRSGTKWLFNVVSDSDLMDAWLSRVDDDEVLDGDVAQRRKTQSSTKYGALIDLVEPPELLIVILGVKSARNSAMNEVMLEVLRTRTHLQKPVWVFDQPEYLFAHGHISYNEICGNIVRDWPHIKLDVKQPVTQVHRAVMSQPTQPTAVKPRPVQVVREEEPPPQVEEDDWLKIEMAKMDEKASKKKWK